MDTIELWARNDDAVREAIELGNAHSSGFSGDTPTLLQSA
jgi:hypothetical protein